MSDATATAPTGLPVRETSPLAARAARTLDAAVEHLLSRQHPDGWWRGLLETNVTMDAEDLLMREFLGVRTEQQTRASARWIRSNQRSDGSWANYWGGPPNISTTAEAYVALRLAGDQPDDPHMVRARDVVLGQGGLESTRVFTRIWLALFGLWDWDRLPSLPPELVFLPRWVPLNLYDFACWARQTVAPITILGTVRPRRELGFGVDELRRGADEDVPSGGSRFFRGVDRALRGYARLPRQPMRRTALRQTAEWIIARQEADGSWGGIQPPWVYSLMALHALGYDVDHPVVAHGLAGWERFTVTDGSGDDEVRWVEACQSPVWDTALAVIALADAGAPADHPQLQRARDWLLQEEICTAGDWAVRRPDAPAGGWAFEFDNDGYADIDDTAEVILALRRTTPSAQVDDAVERSGGWLRAMQCRDGGWGAFDADNTREIAYRLPFCDFGAVIDPPSADVTAHVLEMLAREGRGSSEAARRAVRWLRDDQRADGSWFGRWGANHVYGTGAVVPALVAAGLPADDPAITRAVRWLLSHQNQDGGWGENLRSYDYPSWVGRGDSTPSQTAWALLALHAVGESDSAAATRGVEWLVRHQRADGGWDEPQYTGTGFPGDFYINYHLYRVVFPISALGRILGRQRLGSTG